MLVTVFSFFSVLNVVESFCYYMPGITVIKVFLTVRFLFLVVDISGSNRILSAFGCQVNCNVIQIMQINASFK